MSKLTVLCVALVTVLGGAGCGKGGDAKAVDTGPKAPDPLAIATAEATLEEVPRKVDVTGTLAPWAEATLSLEADGRIAEVKVDLGDKVSKGDVLARVVAQTYSLRRDQAAAELSAAQADFVRIQDLVKQDMAPKAQLDEARRRLSTARANVGLARKQLSDTALRAPIDGTISMRKINEGEYARLGMEAFRIVQTQPLKLKVNAPERYFADVKVGDSVEATTDAHTEPLQGEVSRIGPAVTPETRSFPVEARFENSDDVIKPGAFARAIIKTATSGMAITVPESAVLMFAGNPRVFVVANGKVTERTVEIAGRFQDRVAIAKGLESGEVVATTLLERLSDGVRVAPKAAGEGSEAKAEEKHDETTAAGVDAGLMEKADKL